MLNCIPSWLFLCHIKIKCLYWTFFFWLSFRKILSNHNATMSCARKIPSSLVTAGMLLKNIAICRFLILNNDRVCSLLNQSLLVSILFWLTHRCLVSDFLFFMTMAWHILFFWFQSRVRTVARGFCRVNSIRVKQQGDCFSQGIKERIFEQLRLYFPQIAYLLCWWQSRHFVNTYHLESICLPIEW